MECRPGCGACCVAVSITSPIPGMAGGKPSGVPCVNLDPETHACLIWNQPGYPAFCRGLKPTSEMCGSSRDEALSYLYVLEEATYPD